MYVKKSKKSRKRSLSNGKVLQSNKENTSVPGKQTNKQANKNHTISNSTKKKVG